MRISAKAEYACVAMLELAANYGEPQPVRIKAIADAQGIPQRFLVQILLQLKTAGLVASVRGASGGYQLARPPETISLADDHQRHRRPHPDAALRPGRGQPLAGRRGAARRLARDPGRGAAPAREPDPRRAAPPRQQTNALSYQI